MKNVFFSVLIALLVLPAFTPWMPHGVLHALHDHQESHHQSLTLSSKTAQGHQHVANDHGTQTQASSGYHPINLDVITYFNEYLHVELQSPDQITLTAPAQDNHDIAFVLPADIEPHQRYELTSVQSRAPPDWRRYRPDSAPVYLATQRLRI